MDQVSTGSREGAGAQPKCLPAAVLPGAPARQREYPARPYGCSPAPALSWVPWLRAPMSPGTLKASWPSSGACPGITPRCTSPTILFLETEEQSGQESPPGLATESGLMGTLVLGSLWISWD